MGVPKVGARGRPLAPRGGQDVSGQDVSGHDPQGDRPPGKINNIKEPLNLCPRTLTNLLFILKKFFLILQFMGIGSQKFPIGRDLCILLFCLILFFIYPLKIHLIIYYGQKLCTFLFLN